MKALIKLKKHLKPGQVYRRADLNQWTTAVDRHLNQLVKNGTLQKLSRGLYCYPINSIFGKVPPEDNKLIQTFLKSHDFLLISPNSYNSLNVGTTQLYNTQIVYNYKRHGKFILGGKCFDFRLKYKFPKKVTQEFLFIDLLNNLNDLAENSEDVLSRVKEKLLHMELNKVNKAINNFASQRTKKLLMVKNKEGSIK